MLFSQALEERHFMKREISLRQPIARNIPCLMTKKFPLHAILPRLVREQDHATHETLELAERESSFDWTLRSHCPCGDRVSHCRALGADARSLLGGNRDSSRNAIQSRRYADALRRAHRCHRRGRVSRS